MDWLTRFYAFGRVDLTIRARNARPAFTPPRGF